MMHNNAFNPDWAYPSLRSGQASRLRRALGVQGTCRYIRIVV